MFGFFNKSLAVVLSFKGEADVPFFQASGAEFDEVYVGTGAKRVRQLFQVAILYWASYGFNMSRVCCKLCERWVLSSVPLIVRAFITEFGCVLSVVF